jgi:hypothetical protein
VVLSHNPMLYCGIRAIAGQATTRGIAEEGCGVGLCANQRCDSPPRGTQRPVQGLLEFARDAFRLTGLSLELKQPVILGRNEQAVANVLQLHALVLAP